MKSFLAFPTLLSFALASVPSTEPKLDPSVPIYLGEVFWPPSMTLLAWLPTTMENELDWCMKATDAGPEHLFSLSGVDALQINDYWGEHAYITREGKHFAGCYITPESVRIGSCQGAKDWDCEGGHKYTGPGTRKWTCWIREQERERRDMIERSVSSNGMGERLTDAEYRPTNIVKVAPASNSILAAFTPGVTGI